MGHHRHGLDATLQYIKTFSPRWQSETPGDPVVGTDPNYTGDKKTAAIEMGKQLFHAKAQCSASCHPNFVTHEELYRLSKAATGNEITEFAADMYLAKIRNRSIASSGSRAGRSSRIASAAAGEDYAAGLRARLLRPRRRDHAD